MSTPEFVLALREKVGHAPLWLPGVTGVVVRDANAPDPEVLMVRRADNGAWTPVTGIVDPGEHPADAVVREVAEETGVEAVPVRLARVGVTEPGVYPNGDQVQFIELTFRLEWRSGEPHPADGENTDARWCAVSRLPALGQDMRARIDAALADDERAAFFAGGELVR
ncbi:putative MutT/NUDIX-family protein [Luteimicrobium album]|uniref:MutT/NUDIX-family protein n=1 Tax=Luteimicrobium album TaxID=1054550 RepID=A0ABQ6HYF8_9MICO|nr:NUDIX domain-containing protein [Luteimicrobium album]GMA23544.1 putative MutT/NUDIX-family protein [Luteimicrobium album]